MPGASAAHAQMGDWSTIGCYVALANDLHPLFDAGARDPAAARPQCEPDFLTGGTREADIKGTASTRTVIASTKPNLAPPKDVNVAASKRPNVAAPSIISGASSKNGKPRSIKTSKSSP